VDGGFFADNDRCIDLDLESSKMQIQNLKCSIASDHYRERIGETYCGSSGTTSSGISSAINEKDVALKLKYITFTGFQDREDCWRALLAKLFKVVFGERALLFESCKLKRSATGDAR
jgi:hypothetical protein